MEYRFLGNTGVKVSSVCLGTMMFGGQTTESDSINIMHKAFDNGINFVDNEQRVFFFDIEFFQNGVNSRDLIQYRLIGGIADMQQQIGLPSLLQGCLETCN